MKTIIKISLLLTFITLPMEKVVAQSNGVAFNIQPNCNRISGKSWRSCGTIIVNWDGSVKSTINTSSNRWQGFTGAIKIQFKDGHKRVVYEITTPSYGVNGESSRVDNWSTKIPKEVLKMSRYGSAIGIHTSSNRTIKMFTKKGMEYLNQQTGGGFQFK